MSVVPKKGIPPDNPGRQCVYLLAAMRTPQGTRQGRQMLQPTAWYQSEMTSGVERRLISICSAEVSIVVWWTEMVAE